MKQKGQRLAQREIDFDSYKCFKQRTSLVPGKNKCNTRGFYYRGSNKSIFGYPLIEIENLPDWPISQTSLMKQKGQRLAQLEIDFDSYKCLKQQKSLAPGQSQMSN